MEKEDSKSGRRGAIMEDFGVTAGKGGDRRKRMKITGIG